MAVIGRHNIAKMTSATTGTGTLTLGSASSGCNTFANAGVTDGEQVTYVIRDGANTEVGRGIYTASGTTLTRATILSSTNGGSAISCSGSETVAITVAAEDMFPYAAYYNSGADTVTNGTDDSELTLNSEWFDQNGLATLASNEITIARKGIYKFWASLYISSATAFNGYVKFDFDGFYVKAGYTTAMGILDTYLFIGPVTYQINTNGEVVGPLLFSNHAGSTIDAAINEIGFEKVGDLV